MDPIKSCILKFRSSLKVATIPKNAIFNLFKNF